MVYLLSSPQEKLRDQSVELHGNRQAYTCTHVHVHVNAQCTCSDLKLIESTTLHACALYM